MINGYTIPSLLSNLCCLLLNNPHSIVTQYVVIFFYMKIKGHMVLKNTVMADPGLCPIELRHQFTKKKAEGKNFRVMTYNILADFYCARSSRKYCPEYALNIDYRKQRLLKEIIGYNADLICLQEVDVKVFQDDFQPVLSDFGYDSHFIRKGKSLEGLAFFFDKNRFKLLYSTSLMFCKQINKDPQFADVWDKIAKNKKLRKKMLSTHTTLQITVVESLECKEILVIGNIHLSAFARTAHIRLLHGGLAIKYLENMVNELKEKYPRKRISLIFCGDFNSTPKCGIFQLYTTGEVPQNHFEYSKIAAESVQGVTVRHGFRLGSAYGTPMYTNFTARHHSCLDYIFYDESNLALSQLVPLPSHKDVMEHKTLPSIVFPSDHLALVADLTWNTKVHTFPCQVSQLLGLNLL